MSHHLVEAENLRHVYPDGTVALRNVSFRITHGESVAVIGANGAGKSTLLLHLNGYLAPTAGEVRIGDLSFTKKTLPEIRRRVGMVFQDPDDQLFSPTVREDVAFGPLNQRLPAEQVEHAVQRALAWVDLAGFEERSPHHMSFGEKKRVSLATVLSMDPEILVLDEPVANLDPRGRREFIELIGILEATKVVVTHDLDMARTVCDRIVLMDKGEVVADGRPEKLLSDIKLLERHGLI